MVQFVQLLILSHMTAFVGPLIKSRASVVNSKNHLFPWWECVKRPFLFLAQPGQRLDEHQWSSWDKLNLPMLCCALLPSKKENQMTSRPVNPSRVFGQCVIFLFYFVMPLIPTKKVFSQPKSQFSSKPCHHRKINGRRQSLPASTPPGPLAPCAGYAGCNKTAGWRGIF